MPDTPSHSVPTVEKKTAKPPGVLPRNIQGWVIAGISLLMVLVIALSGKKQPKAPASSALAPVPVPTDPSEARIQEYRARIEQQTRKIAAEQAELEQARTALAATAAPAPLSSVGSHAPPEYRPRGEQSTLQAARQKREYESLFASNIALTYRQAGPDGATDRTRANSATDAPPEPSKSNKVSAKTTAGREQYQLFEGTIIETVLTNRLDGSFSGPVNCLVTTDVYAHDRWTLLIPQGSRVLGEAKRVETFGQQRLAVVFHRLILPNGFSISLDQFKGLNQVGETGLRDKVNHHYLQVFGVSLAIGAIAGAGQASTRYGYDTSGADAYVQGMGDSLSQSSLRILDRYLNVLPTFTIREGHRVKVYLSNDLHLPAYEGQEHPAHPSEGS